MKYWMRWLGVLPAAYLARFLTDLPLHWMLYAPYRDTQELGPSQGHLMRDILAAMIPEPVFSPFIGAIAFIWAGSIVAPNHPTRTATVLFGFWLLVSVVLTIVSLSGGQFFGHQVYLQYSGIAPLMGLIGAGVGLYAVRKEYSNRVTNADLKVESAFSQTGS